METHVTFTATVWRTTSVSRIKADYVVVYRKPDGAQGAIEANLVLTQMNDTGGRRTVVGVIDAHTCEVIPAFDFKGYEGLMNIHVWRARPTRITLLPIDYQA